jgi:hypothetical protein
MKMLEADTEGVVWMMMVSSWVVVIDGGLGNVQAKQWWRGDGSGLDFLLGVGEGINGVWDRGVVSNSEHAQVNGNM